MAKELLAMNNLVLHGEKPLAAFVQQDEAVEYAKNIRSRIINSDGTLIRVIGGLKTIPQTVFAI